MIVVSGVAICERAGLYPSSGAAGAPETLEAALWYTGADLPSSGAITSWPARIDTLSRGSLVPLTAGDFASVTGPPTAETINGQRVARATNSSPGNAVEQGFIGAAAGTPVAGDKTMLVVVSDGGILTPQYYIADTENSQPHLRRFTGGQFRYSGDPNVNITRAIGTEWFVFAGRVTGSLHEAYLDSTGVADASATGLVAILRQLIVGCDRLGSDATDGRWREIVVFDRALDDAEMATLLGWAAGVRDGLNA